MGLIGLIGLIGPIAPADRRKYGTVTNGPKLRLREIRDGKYGTVTNGMKISL